MVAPAIHTLPAGVIARLLAPVPLSPKYVEYTNALPAGLSLRTKPPPEGAAVWNAPGVVGKSDDPAPPET